MPHKTYTPTQKLQAVQDIITKKKRPTQIARELNVTENTLISTRVSSIREL